MEKIREGIFAVHKPKGPTSHDVVDRIRELTGVRVVGHAGTLDPLASGVLVVGVGREATRKLHEVVSAEKEYIADVRFGEESATDDAEGEKTAIAHDTQPTEEEIRETLKSFVGQIMQMPPQYSALKLGGRPAYKFARKGRVAPLSTRQVFVKEIELLEYRWPNLKLRIVTGPGVYIRSLARDIGRALKVGGYIAELERTRVGDFTKDSAVVLENFPGARK